MDSVVASKWKLVNEDWLGNKVPWWMRGVGSGLLSTN